MLERSPCEIGLGEGARLDVPSYAASARRVLSLSKQDWPPTPPAQDDARRSAAPCAMGFAIGTGLCV